MFVYTLLCNNPTLVPGEIYNLPGFFLCILKFKFTNHKTNVTLRISQKIKLFMKCCCSVFKKSVRGT